MGCRCCCGAGDGSEGLDMQEERGRRKSEVSLPACLLGVAYEFTVNTGWSWSWDKVEAGEKR